MIAYPVFFCSDLTAFFEIDWVSTSFSSAYKSTALEAVASRIEGIFDIGQLGLRPIRSRYTGHREESGRENHLGFGKRTPRFYSGL